jgi:hypothetical protein
LYKISLAALNWLASSTAYKAAFFEVAEKSVGTKIVFILELGVKCSIKV